MKLAKARQTLLCTVLWCKPCASCRRQTPTLQKKMNRVKIGSHCWPSQQCCVCWRNCRGRTPAVQLTKSAVLRLLAELSRSYAGCAVLICQHSYHAGQSELITEVRVVFFVIVVLQWYGLASWWCFRAGWQEWYPAVWESWCNLE